jgi:transposase-like protein
MDIQKQAVKEYLLQGYSYRALAEKYGVSRSTINKWVLVYQGIHNIPRSHKQTSYDLQQKTLGKRSKQPTQQQQNELEKKIALLEKQLDWERLKSHALDA